MASKCSIGKNTSGRNQPPSCEVKDSVSHKPIEFRTFNPYGIYYPHISSQSTCDITYNCSPKTPDPNQDSSLNEELHGVTPKDHVYRIPNC